VANPEILQKLREALDTARQRSEAASAHFDEVLRDVPSGLPQPDGVERVRLASVEFIRSRQILLDAHLKLENFIAYGTIPDELESPRKPPAAKTDPKANITPRRRG
jgi:hypothetical protein